MKLTREDKVFFVRDASNRPLSIVRLRYHPTAPYLFAQVLDRHVAIWDTNAAMVEPKGKIEYKKPHVPGELHASHELGWIRGFDIAPNGQQVVTGGSDRHLKWWQWDNGRLSAKPLADVVAHDGWIEAVAFAPDGQRIASASADKTVKIWDANRRELLHTLTGHSRYLRDLCWSADGKWLISCGEEGRVIVWDAKTMQAARTIDFGEANNQYGQIVPPSGALHVRLSADGKWLAVAGARKVSLYDFHTGEVVGMESNIGQQACFSPRGLILAAGGDRVKVMSLDATKLIAPPRDKKGQPQIPKSIPGATEFGNLALGEYCLGMAFHHDGERLAVGKNDGSVECHRLGG